MECVGELTAHLVENSETGKPKRNLSRTQVSREANRPQDDAEGSLGWVSWAGAESIAGCNGPTEPSCCNAQFLERRRNFGGNVRDESLGGRPIRKLKIGPERREHTGEMRLTGPIKA